MGMFDDLIKEIKNFIDEMDTGSDKSRSQPFLEEFWGKRRNLEDAIDIANGKEKGVLDKLLNFFNKKGEENDMEPY